MKPLVYTHTFPNGGVYFGNAKLSKSMKGRSQEVGHTAKIAAKK